MPLPLLLVLLYLVALGLVGSAASRRIRAGVAPGSRREYVLGGARSGALILFATLAATNFSAFTVFGLSGAGYRIGWAYYPAIGFGTGLMALTFLFLGIPLRRLSAERGYLSPADFIRDRYGSPALARAYSFCLVAITVPYLAAQAVAGGRMVALMTGIPYSAASFLLVAVTALYTCRGGFRAVAATDALQLAVLAAGAVAAFAAVFGLAGGAAGATARLLASSPDHLSRAGAGAGVGLERLLGLWLLWFLADPLFPQMFQRFYAARDDESLRRASILYPLVCGILFFLTVGVGVTGAALLPGLPPSESEQIFPRLAAIHSDPSAGSLFALAAVAALMSTMDSQLLSLSSMIVQDLAPPASRSRRTDAALVAGLALLSWLVSLSPPVLILDALTGLSFPAYAALAAPVWAGIYCRRTDARAASASLVLGLALVAAEAAGFFSFDPVPAVAVNLGAQALVIAAFGFAACRAQPLGSFPGIVPRFRPVWFAALLGAAALGTVAWEYGAAPVLLGGVPRWVWQSAASCGLLSLVIALWKPEPPASAGS